jgi:hypothetical protein
MFYLQKLKASSNAFTSTIDVADESDDEFRQAQEIGINE